MAKKEKRTQKRRVTFKLEASGANEDILAGDFNGWDVKWRTMKRNNKGSWSKVSVFLVEGI